MIIWIEMIILILACMGFPPMAHSSQGPDINNYSWGQSYIGLGDLTENLNNDGRSLRKLKRPVVAIIDTGADLSHPSLTGKIWINPGESGKDANGNDRSNNQVDDDRNGFIDDVHGWNFATNDNDLSDRHGHGTHIAGIISGNRISKIGFRGVAQNAQLMILKYYDPKNHKKNNLSRTLKALKYAIDRNVDIINYSGGGIEWNAEEKRLLATANQKGIIVVAAAGNEKNNSDEKAFYPASYDLENIISIGAHDKMGRLLKTSNFGHGSVDTLAPGADIFSALPNGEYGYMSGTSQATAFVSGVVAEILTQQPSRRSPEDILASLRVPNKKSVEFSKWTKMGVQIDVKKSSFSRGLGQSAHDQKLSQAPNEFDEQFTSSWAETTPLL